MPKLKICGIKGNPVCRKLASTSLMSIIDMELT